ncbi:MAG: hypothetical protein MAGBODY4_00917 [Candidatus Marinimicrobia bacterium]|nr:hypothetical protein [Candidatus Neomarinimicrobiota bacterium]
MWQQIIARQWWKPALGVFFGGLAGFGYYYFIGCAAGTCPLQSNPYVMTGYGILLGLVLGIPGKKKNESDNAKNEVKEKA